MLGFLRGVRGDSLEYTGNKINFSNTLLEVVWKPHISNKCRDPIIATIQGGHKTTPYRLIVWA
jgi:hypothetical protein